MPQAREYSEKKINYFAKLDEMLNTYSKLVFVEVDNVQSQQMHKVRKALRGKAEILMGKNTLMRKVFAQRASAEHATELDKILFQKIVTEKMLVGNLGIIFTNAAYSEITSAIKTNRIQAPARVGSIAPLDVTIPAGNTGLEPGATAFFQALGIPTKIVKGCVEISADKKVLSVGDKVDNSVAALLQKLNIKPFFYGLSIKFIFDAGSVFGPEILEITDDFYAKNMSEAIKNIASISLEIGYPTEASIPHQIMNAFKDMMAISISTKYEFTEFNGATIRKNIIEGKPAPAESPKKAASPKKDSKAPAKAKEPEPEEEDDVGLGGLF